MKTLQPIRRDLSTAERVAIVKARINRNAYRHGILLTTADRLLPVLMPDASLAMDVSGQYEEDAERWDFQS